MLKLLWELPYCAEPQPTSTVQCDWREIFAAAQNADLFVAVCPASKTREGDNGNKSVMTITVMMIAETESGRDSLSHQSPWLLLYDLHEPIRSPHPLPTRSC